MLPKSRIVSALAIGAGVAVTVGGLAAPMVMPTDARLPLDLASTTWTITDEAATSAPIYDSEAEAVVGPVTHQIHLQIQEPAASDIATVRIGSSWFHDKAAGTGEAAPSNEDLISAQTWSYSLDRVTGEAFSEATLSHTVGMPPSKSEVPGVWLKFPSQAEPTTYDVFDETLRGAFPAVFVDETTENGRTIYHYRQEIEPTNVAVRYAGMFNTRVVPTEGGGTEQTYLFHEAMRDIAVDQVSGLVVGLKVDQRQYYATADGMEVAPVLDFHGTMSPENTAALIDAASEVTDPATIQRWRWIIVGLGVVVMLAGLIGAFVSGRRGRGELASSPSRHQLKA